MLTKVQVENNKQEFLSLVKSIDRDGSEMDRLVGWLEKSDFFLAPASTRYHAAYEGGLCEHSLNVYKSLVKLAETFMPNADQTSLKIIALFHDIAKANYYIKYKRNVKDEITGQWNQVEEYKVRDVEERFIYGNHEETSTFMINSFIPLSPEEQSSILHHHGGMSFDSSKTDVGMIYTRYPLAALLHMADMGACFVLER